MGAQGEVLAGCSGSDLGLAEKSQGEQHPQGSFHRRGGLMVVVSTAMGLLADIPWGLLHSPVVWSEGGFVSWASRQGASLHVGPS